MKTIVLALAVCCAHGPLSASAKDGKIQTVKELADCNCEVGTQLISTTGEAFGVASVAMEHDHKIALFCPPERLAITEDQYVQILKGFLEKNSWRGNASWQLYQFEVLESLKDAFPCKN